MACPGERVMKKILMAVFVSMCIFPVAGNAQGIEDGDGMVSLYGGLGSALEKSMIEVDGENLSWGNFGAEVGLSYLYFPTSYLGLGLDVHLANFKGTQMVEDVRGRWFWHTLESDFDMQTLQLMGAGRINLNPQSPVRLYIPFGAGLTLSNGTMKYTWDEEFDLGEESVTDASWGGYVGLGLEFDQGTNYSWSIEARYNVFDYDDSRLAGDIGGALVGKDTRRSYVSLAFRLNFG